MNKLHIALLVVVAIFMSWFVTRMIYTRRAMEFFKTYFNPGSNNLEEDIKGYRFAFGDKRPDTDAYFGFDDSLESGFSKRLLPDIIPQETYVKKM
jgi:hypothetical protein